MEQKKNVTIRMPPTQSKVLKELAAKEGKTISDIIRELVGGYIEKRHQDLPEDDNS